MPTHPGFDTKPYVRLLEEVGPYQVWLVDGPWIRKYIQREFSNFCHHLTKPKGIGGDAFKEVPCNIFWIDSHVNEAEIPFFVDRLILEHYLMHQGWSYEKAEAAGTRVELRERSKVDANFGVRSAINASIQGADWESIVKRVELRHLQDSETLGFQVYLADGLVVRTPPPAGIGDPRFCSGGHSQVYGYIPDNHLWLDNTEPPKDWNYFMLHEGNEFIEQRDHDLKYPPAHKLSSALEWKCRLNPMLLPSELRKLGLSPIKVGRRL
jgi:hypothetical protein